MDFQDDAAEFSVEDVDTIVKNAITGCLTDVMYNPKKVSHKTNARFRCCLIAGVGFKTVFVSCFVIICVLPA